MGRLTGRTAIIVGADPITIGIATRYLIEGAKVTIIADEGSLALCPAPDGAALAKIALSPGEADKAIIAKAAGASLDILVLGGADVPEQKDWISVSALTLDALRLTEDRLVVQSLIALQACESALKATEDAGIIFLYSPAGIWSDGGWSDHTISYHARHGLMRAVASEWGPVRANMLVPFADTPGFRKHRERNPKEVDDRTSLTAMKRVGDPVNDIGRVAVFLASDDTRYVTGMMIHADGGAHMIAPPIEAKMPVAS